MNSLVFSPRQLKEESYLSIDAVLIPEQAASSFWEEISTFLSKLSKSTPTLILGKNKFTLPYDKKIIQRCILIHKEFPLEDLAPLIEELTRENKLKSKREHQFGIFVLDREQRKIFWEESSTQLTKKEFFLLELLLSNAGQIISRERIIDYVWDKRQYISQNTIDVYMSRLRKKLKISPQHPLIRTIPCLGYELDPGNLQMSNKVAA